MTERSIYTEGPFVSVIVAVYNSEDCMHVCLDAIKNQTYGNIEVILVDDGSTDGSGRICEEYAVQNMQWQVIHHSENRGLWAARNSGKEIAKGDYLLFADADDYMHVDAIKTLLNVIRQDIDCDLAIADFKPTSNSNEDNYKALEIQGCRSMTRDEIMYGFMCSNRERLLLSFQWNKLYKRELIEDIWCEEYIRSQDRDFNFRTYLGVKKAVFIDCPLFFYVTSRPNSLSNLAATRNLNILCTIKMYNKYLVDSIGEQYRDYVLVDLFRWMVRYRVDSISNGDKSAVYQKCREYERKYLFEYLTSNRRVNIIEKVFRIFLLHHPKIARYWLYK